MANFIAETNAIKNVCLLGHGGNGKTSILEAMLYITGETDRLGKTADGNTVSDYDPEEIKRQYSISDSVAPTFYNGKKINIIDTPARLISRAKLWRVSESEEQPLSSWTQKAE